MPKSKVLLGALLLLLFWGPGTQASNEGKVALVMKALSNPFFSKMEAGAKKYAQEGNIPLEVFGVERETDVERQIGIVENLIFRGYGAIVVAPADSKQLVLVCKKALERNVVVINIDNPLHLATMQEYGLSIPFVGSDNRIGAGRIGAYIKRKLNGRGQVIVIEGIRGVENAELRKIGFIEAVTADSQIQVVASESANWHTDEALSLAVRLLKMHPKVDAIFCANDKMAVGVLQALELLDLGRQVLVAGYDNIDAVRYEMRNGRMHATAEQHPELMGQFGVELARRGLKGETLPAYVPTPIDLITHEDFGKIIALSISNRSSMFFTLLHQGAQEAAEMYGAQLLMADANNREAQQLTDISNFLQHPLDALIVNPTNMETVTPGIELANSRDVPVITVDRKAAGGNIICHIESDNVEGGKMAAQVLARHLRGQGKIVEIEGIPGTSAAQERGMGFNHALRGYPGLNVVAREAANFDRKEAQTRMRRILQEQIDFDAVFAHNDDMILGVIEALEGLRPELSKMLIGFDGLPEAVAAVQTGRLTATIAQQPRLMGKLAIQSAIQFLRGEKLPQVIAVELELIEK
ncbi:MAG: substrate-binding domain-containing protein [Desulfobacterales bacterium]|nr:MAG: substrate-binding domain-containing protein [Desulfobacterales bacterium]